VRLNKNQILVIKMKLVMEKTQIPNLTPLKSIKIRICLMKQRRKPKMRPRM